MGEAAPAVEQQPQRKVRGMKLLFTLTKDDIDIRTRELVGAVNDRAEKSAEVERKREAAKGLVKTLEAELLGLDKRVNELAQVVRTGQEERVVDVFDMPDAEKFAVNTVRTDTGEIVATRGMSEVERELVRKQREAEKQRAMFQLTDPKPIEPEQEASPATSGKTRKAGPPDPPRPVGHNPVG